MFLNTDVISNFIVGKQRARVLGVSREGPPVNDKTSLTLYVNTENAMRCTSNLMAALNTVRPGYVDLEIIYVNHDAERAEDDSVMVIPCLKVQRNGCCSFVVGDLADATEVQQAMSA